MEAEVKELEEKLHSVKTERREWESRLKESEHLLQGKKALRTKNADCLFFFLQCI